MKGIEKGYCANVSARKREKKNKKSIVPPGDEAKK
jgi:hypothetical protein